MGTLAHITIDLDIKELTQTIYIDRNGLSYIHSATYLQENITNICGLDQVKGILLQTKDLVTLIGWQCL